MTMSLEERAENWHNEKYGKDVDVYATYRKLVEEVGELGEAIMKADLEHSANFGNVREELGDVGLVLTHLIRRFVPWNISVADVFHEALDKVEAREGHPDKRRAFRKMLEGVRKDQEDISDNTWLVPWA